MKTRFLLVIVLLATVFISCKNEKSDESKEIKTTKEANLFNVTLNVTVKKDDTFSLFYTDDGSTDFSKIQPIWVDVKGSNSPQDVIFNLPQDVIPSQIRLDFGLNKNQEEIIINKFKMNYFAKSFEVTGDKFFIYFDPDKSKTIFDKDKSTINAVVKDGVRQSPSFYPNTKPLGEEITKLIK